MTTATATDAPSLHHAVRQYGLWRTGPGGYSSSTWAGEQPGLVAFSDYCADQGVYYFAGVDDDLVTNWWAQLTADVAEATAVTRLHQLRSFLGWAVRKGYLADDPSLFIRAARPIPELRERLNARELLTMVAAADFPQHRIILALCANLALRQAELKRLTIRDLNLDGGTLTVRVSKTRDTPPDPMPLTTELSSELRQWLVHYRATCTGLGPTSHLVPAQFFSNGRIGYRPERSIAEPEDVVKRALTKIGWADVKGEGIHTVRRSVARLYFDAVLADEGDAKFDEALLGCMRLLHHDRAETTLRYIGVDRQTLARDRFLKGRPFLSRLAGPSHLLALVK